MAEVTEKSAPKKSSGAPPAPEESKGDRLVNVNRVTSVTKGGRTFGFSAISVYGEPAERGKSAAVGCGLGKGLEAPLAIKKSMADARRNMHKVELKGATLQHPVSATYGATTVTLIPASKGTGLIAGSAVRAVLEVVGVEDALTKVIGSTNPINVVKATIKGLRSTISAQAMAEKRGKSISDIVESHNGE